MSSKANLENMCIAQKAMEYNEKTFIYSVIPNLARLMSERKLYANDALYNKTDSIDAVIYANDKIKQLLGL